MKNSLKMLILALILFTTAFGVVSCLKEDASSNSVQQVENATNPSSSEEASGRSELAAALYKVKVEVLEQVAVESGLRIYAGSANQFTNTCNGTMLIVSPFTLKGCPNQNCAIYPNTQLIPSSSIKSSSFDLRICGDACNYTPNSIALFGSEKAKYVVKLTVINILTNKETSSKTYTIVRTNGYYTSPINTKVVSGVIQ